MNDQWLRSTVLTQMSALKLSKAEIARRADVPYDTVRDLERRPNASTAFENGIRILDALKKISQERGELFDPLPEYAGGDGADDGTDVTKIPRYDVQLSAGSGAINFESSKIDIPIPFAPDFLPKKLGRDSADGLTIVEAAGDSMTPTIDDGDLIMLDMNDTRHRAGIFGFELAGETYVKRLEWTEFGIHLISDNQLYPMRALSPEKAEAESFKLIGRVVWVGRVFRS